MITADRRSTSQAERVSTRISESGTLRLCVESVQPARDSRQAIYKEWSRKAIGFSEMGADFVTGVVAVSASYRIDLWLHACPQHEYPLREIVAVSCIVALCVVLLLHRNGGYHGSGSLLHVRETERALRVSAQSLLLLLPFSLLFKLALSHAAFAIAFIVTSSLLILRKRLVSSPGRTLHARESTTQRVVVHSAGDKDGLLRPIRQHAVPWHYAIAKRAADLIVSSTLLVLLAPVFLLIGLLIRLDSPGPALFVQKRVGRNGKLFNIYKFRSMYTNACKYDSSPTTSSDPRITRLGRFLRRSCLDELPQLVNVLRGTMSLVGPRPEMPFIVRAYNSRQQQRLQALPGITGMWQLSADRALPIHENVEYDLYYLSNRTLFMDLAILIHTLFYAIGEGV